MKPLLLQVGSVTPKMLARFAKTFDLVTASDLDVDLTTFAEGPDPAGLKDRIEAIATFGAETIPNTLLDALPDLKMISNYGVGYDGIDAAYAAQKGIMVTHTPGVLNAEVANTTIMLMLATVRRLVPYDRYVRDGRWEKEGNVSLTGTLEGARVGFVGMGRIGQEIAMRLAVFNCEISYHARNQRNDLAYRYFADLSELAGSVDFLVVITPGGPSTRHLVDGDVIRALGKNGTLINVARGTVVDEKAMTEALEKGQLGAAGLDVFEHEPKIPHSFRDMDNVVLLPHVGSATHQTRDAMGALTCLNLELFFAGKPVITPVPECDNLARQTT